MADMAATQPETTGEVGTRRDFLYLLTGATAAVGTAALLWPLVDSMNPSADVLALGSIEVDISGIDEGMRVTAKWRGKPIFIDHRPPAEIEEARSVDVAGLRDPQTDEERTIKPEWLVVIGICTHLGCVPLGQGANDTRGEYGGWFCPCHGSVYDTSGRIPQGPAPTNLIVPPYQFTSDDVLQIG
jgi:ubiquinol-cytochrome c reductase iron-sulfur subunit